MLISPILAQWSFNPNLIPLWGQNGSFHVLSKGQLISKCPFGVKTSSKIPTKLFLDICPEIWCTFLWASWKLFEASCRLPYSWYYLLLKSPGSWKSFQEAPKKVQKISGQKYRNSFVGFLEEFLIPIEHFEINWPLKLLEMFMMELLY